MKCKLHPTYKGVRKPRAKPTLENIANCSCVRIFMERNPDKKVYSNFIGGQIMSLNDWRKAGRESAQRLIKAFADYEQQA